MSAKYFVYGGRWRELDVVSGCVSGWARRARFVYVRRGRLRLAPRRRVLPALRALAAGCVSAVTVSARLPALPKESTDHRRKSRNLHPPLSFRPALYEAPQYGPHCCCAHNHQLQAAAHQQCSTRCLAAAPSYPAQHRVTVDAAVQHLPPENHTLTISLTNHTPPIQPAMVTTIIDTNTEAKNQRVILEEKSPKKRARIESDSDEIFHKPNKTVRLDSESPVNNAVNRQTKRQEVQKSEESSGGMCKELTIPESDVRALRSYVARNMKNALEGFDADDEYKLALFYAINPLVDVARCPLTEKAIRERLPLALKPFAARLGLAPSPRPRVNVQTTNNSDSEDDVFHKSNKRYISLRNRNTAKREINANVKQGPNNKYRGAVDSDESENNEAPKPKNRESRTSTSDSDRDFTNKNEGVDNVRRASLRQRRPQGNVRDGMSQSDDESIRKRRASLRSAETNSKTDSQDSDRDEQVNIGNKRNSLRKKTEKQRKADTEDSDSDGRAKNEHRRKSLRNKDQTNTTSQDSDDSSDFQTNMKRLDSLRKNTARKDDTQTSDSEVNRRNVKDKRNSLKKAEIIAKHESDSDSQEQITNRRSSRKKVESQSKDQDSDSDSQDNTAHKRNTILTNAEIQRKVNSPDSISDSQEHIENRRNSLRKRVELVKSDKSQGITNKRASLRNQTHKTDIQVLSDSDYESDGHKKIDKTKTRSPHKKITTTKATQDSDNDDVVDKMHGEVLLKKTVIKNKGIANKSVYGNSVISNHELSETDKVSKQNTKELIENLSSDSGGTSTKGKLAKVNPPTYKMKRTHVVSKRTPPSASKEYSNLEDHAIVAWVLTGGRARKVNGNLLWKEFEEQYPKLTGISRTWQSLRNRYLRHVLGSLGTLGLPPPDVSRLRAAAAAGEIKSKRNNIDARRNSIFDQTHVSSASARRRPQGTPPPDQSPHKRDTGDVRATHDAETRRERQSRGTPQADGEGGERRSRRSLVTDIAPAPAVAAASSSATTKSRTRKLFNPKLVM